MIEKNGEQDEVVDGARKGQQLVSTEDLFLPLALQLLLEKLEVATCEFLR